MSIVVPLSEQTVYMNTANSKYKKSDTLVKINKSKKYYTLHNILIVLYAIDSIMIIILIVMFVYMFPKQSEYSRKIRKILKTYDRAIVKIKVMPPINNLKLIETESLEELIDARDNLEKPILFYENNHKNQAVFIVTNITEAFIYIIDAYEGK